MIVMAVFWDDKSVLLVGQQLQLLRTTNNARPHISATTKEKSHDYRWELFDNPPYSSDFAPSDYLL